MSETKVYGETTDEKAIRDKARCREIVSEIMKFGVTQDQIVQIAYLLSLELENRAVMLHLSKACKEVMDDSIPKSSSLIINN